MRRLAAFALAGAYAALAALVTAGVFDRLDQWSVDHVMPRLDAGRTQSFAEKLSGLVPFLDQADEGARRIVGDFFTLPGSPLVWLALTLLALVALWRRGERRAAVAWAAAGVAGNATELVCKAIVERDPLTQHGEHVLAFDQSLPSGHALRLVLAAAVLAAAWPRVRAWLALACVPGLVFLVVAGYHTLTDVLAGLLLALFLAALVARLDSEACLRRP